MHVHTHLSKKVEETKYKKAQLDAKKKHAYVWILMHDPSNDGRKQLAIWQLI